MQLKPTARTRLSSDSFIFDADFSRHIHLRPCLPRDNMFIINQAIHDLTYDIVRIYKIYSEVASEGGGSQAPAWHTSA